MMNKLFCPIIFTAVVIVSAGCSSSVSRSQSRTEREALISYVVERDDVTISVTRALPLRGRNIDLTSPYDLRVTRDSVYSYLPYFGRAYSVPYGGGDGLIFEAPVTGYTKTSGSRGLTRIEFDTRSREDSFHYSLDIYPDGTSYITVAPIQRQLINFTGNVDLRREDFSENVIRGPLYLTE